MSTCERSARSMYINSLPCIAAVESSLWYLSILQRGTLFHHGLQQHQSLLQLPGLKAAVQDAVVTSVGRCWMLLDAVGCSISAICSCGFFSALYDSVPSPRLMTSFPTPWSNAMDTRHCERSPAISHALRAPQARPTPLCNMLWLKHIKTL